MPQLYTYQNDSQVEKYISQFMRAMSGFQVKETYEGLEFRKVPVRYGSMDRIVASVLQGRDSMSNNPVPMMAVHLEGIEKDEDRKVSHHHRDIVAYRKDSGEVASSERIAGPALTLNLELAVYASSTTQLFEIVEQLLLIFNPRITIQTDNDVFNSDYISEIELTSINTDTQYPLGTDHRVVMQTFGFRVPVRLRYPYTVDGNVIETVKANIFDESEQNIMTVEETVLNEGS